MSANWVVPELGTDFTNDFEDLLINYIYSKWNISDPAKGSVMKPDYQIEPNTVSFKPGFPDYNRPYECCTVQTRTDLTERYSGKYVFTTIVEVLLRMKRLDRDAIEVDPQLQNMEQEIEDIVQHYNLNDIVGIKDLTFSFPDSKQAVYDGTDDFAKSDWRSIVRVKCLYEKQNIT